MKRVERIMAKTVVVATVALALASCATLEPKPPAERVAFPEYEYAAIGVNGTATVRGQAFLRTRGGDVKTAAGEQVLLNPVTSYSRQWYEVAYLGGRALTEPDPRYWQYIRRTVADADGRFAFSNVPAGRYYVVTRVVWEVSTGYELAAQGGFVVKEISVEEGENLDVIVTW